MANRNTKFARSKGYSDMKRMLAGGEKNYGTKTGVMLDTHKLRAFKGKQLWKPDPKRMAGGAS